MKLTRIVLYSAVIPAVFAAAGSRPAAALEVVDVTYNIKEGGKILFSHENHFKVLFPNVEPGGDDCGACHGTALRPDDRRPYTMADMYKGRSCGACHNGKRAFVLNSCGRCHEVKDVTFRVQPTGDVIFPHKIHIDKIQCDVCHPKIFKPGRNKPSTMAMMDKGKSCGACHNGTRAFAVTDCSRCHLAGKVQIKAKKPWNLTFRHDFHVPKLKCTDCHPGIYPLGYEKQRPRLPMDELHNNKSCGVCHNGSTAFSTSVCQRCHDNM